MLSASWPGSLQGPSGLRAVPEGYETDYPVAGKVRGKPRYYRVRGGFRGSSRTLGTALDTSGNSRSGPYSWGPELTERAGP